MKKSKDKDFDIIFQINEGDTSLFRVLVDKYKDASFSLARSILRNKEDAEDALQESYIRAFSGLKRFKFKSSFSTWLYKIVVNTCNTRYENLKRQHLNIHFDSDLNTEIPDINSVLTDIIILEQKVLVNKILDTLKAEESLLLRLYYLEELSIDEIKQITEFKDSKAKVTLYRARKSFQKEYEKQSIKV